MNKGISNIKFLPFYLVSRIPIRILYLVSDFIYFLVFHILKYRRKVVSTNLLNAFPEKSEKEIRKIEKDFYSHFCDTILEAIKVYSISEKQIKKRFTVKNPELIEEYFKQKRSIILYTGHFGNWEHLVFLPFFLPHQVMTFYRKLSSKYMDQITKLSREGFGVVAVESGNGYRALINYAKKEIPTFTFMLGDQSPRQSNAKHWVKFLNQDTAFFVGTERIAKKINQVVIYSEMIKKSRGVYEIEFFPLSENMDALKDSELIDKFAEKLESSIKKYPHLWLWTHRRWKLKK